MSNATELLRRAAEDLELLNEIGHYSSLSEEIRAFLAAETEAEPVAYMGTSTDGYPNKFRLTKFEGAIPLYTIGVKK